MTAAPTVESIGRIDAAEEALQHAEKMPPGKHAPDLWACDACGWVGRELAPGVPSRWRCAGCRGAVRLGTWADEVRRLRGIIGQGGTAARLVYADWLQEQSEVCGACRGKSAPCGACGGDGLSTGPPECRRCRRCDGTGRLPCPACSGTGRVDHAARCEFIRVQCELARMEAWAATQFLVLPETPPGAHIEALRRRERELLEAHGYAWLARELPGNWIIDAQHPPSHVANRAVSFARGFIDRVVLSWADWLNHAPALLAAAPRPAVALVDEPVCRYTGTSESNPEEVVVYLNDRDGPNLTRGRGPGRASAITAALRSRWPDVRRWGLPGRDWHDDHRHLPDEADAYEEMARRDARPD